MGSRHFTILATFIAVFGLAGAQQRSLLGHGSSDLGEDSFVNRMEMYKTWAHSTGARERRLFSYNGPAPAPKAPSPKPPKIPIVMQPDTGYNCTWPHQKYVDNNVVMYSTGYANLTIPRNKLIENTADFVECQALCDKEDKCQAWTRVAGGDLNTAYNCYLLYDLKTLDPSPAKYLYNHVGPDCDDKAYPQLRYVNDQFPIVFETGTKKRFFPEEYYGCPYKGKPGCKSGDRCNIRS